ncbi:MAG: hypothetical protein GY786_18470, partial [Proteobacteria bacterium]|nr:hypothetical protein [Pseudomonadota bacterium]
MLRPIVQYLIFFSALILSACQPDDNSAASRAVSAWEGPETGTYTSTLVSKLKKDLISAGLSNNQATVLKAAATVNVNNDGKSSVVDIGVLAPIIVEGAENSISSTDANLSDSKKITALITIATSVTEALNGRVVANTPGFNRTVLGIQFAPKTVNYQVVLSAISKTIVENLQNTGIPSEAIEDTLQGLFFSITSKINKDDITVSGLIDASGLISSAAIGALDTALLTSNINTVSTKIVSAIMQGLGVAGLDDSEVASAADNVIKGAIEALDEAAVASADVAAASGYIVESVVSNIPYGEISSVINNITKEAIIALVLSGVTSEHVADAILAIQSGIESGVTLVGASSGDSSLLDTLRNEINSGVSAGKGALTSIIPNCQSNTGGDILDSSIFTGQGCGLVTSSIVINTGHVVVWDGSAVTFSGDISIQPGGVLEITGTEGILSGVIYLSGGTLKSDANVTISGQIFHTESSTIEITGTKTIGYTNINEIEIDPYTLTFSGSGSFNNTSDVILNEPGSGIVLAGSGGSINKVSVSGADLTSDGVDVSSDFSINTLDLKNSTKIQVQNGKTLSIDNLLSIDSGLELVLTENGTVDLNGGLNLSGTLTHTSTIIDLSDSPIALNNSVDFSGGTLVTSSSTTLDLSADIELVSGQKIYLNNLNLNDHALTLGSSTTDLIITNQVVLDAPGETLVTTVADLELINGLSQSDGGITSTGGNIYLHGIPTGGVLDLSGSTLTLNGNLDVTAINSDFTVPDNLATAIDATLIVSGPVIISSLELFDHTLTLTDDLVVTNPMSFDSSGEQILTQNHDLTVIGQVSIIDGAITSTDGNLNLIGGIEMIGGSLSCNGTNSSLTIGADSSFDGGTLDLSDCSISMNGDLRIATDQLNTSNTSSWDTNSNNLTWDGKSADANDLNGEITIDSGGELAIITNDGGTITNTLNLSGTLAVEADVTLDTLIINGNSDISIFNGKTLIVTDPFSLPDSATTLSVSGIGVFNTLGLVTIPSLAGITHSDSTFDAEAGLIINGTYDMASGSLDINGQTLTLGSSTNFSGGALLGTTLATLDISADSIFTAGNDVTFDSLTLGNAALTLGSNLTITNAVAFNDVTQQIITGSHNLTLSSSPSTFNDGTLSSTGGTITLVSGISEVIGSAAISIQDSTFDIGGPFTMSAGAVDIAGSTLSLVGNFIKSGGTFSTQDSTLDIGGLFTMSAGVVDIAGSTLSLAGNFTKSGGTFSTQDSTLDIGGPFTMSAGVVDIAGSTLSLAGNFTKLGGTFNFDTSSDLRLTSSITWTSNSDITV